MYGEKVWNGSYDVLVKGPDKKIYYFKLYNPRYNETEFTKCFGKLKSCELAFIKKKFLYGDVKREFDF